MRLPILILALYSILSLTSMAGMNLGFLFVFLVFVSSYFFSKGVFKNLRMIPDFNHYLRAGGVLFAACLLSLICAKLFPYAYAGHEPEITAHGFLKIWYLFCPWVLLTVFSYQPLAPRLALKFILNAWWSMVIFLLVIALIQYNTGWPFKQVIPTNPEHFHATLFFAHHLSTASILIFPAFTALAVALGALERKEKVRPLEWAAGIAGILILFLSYARTAWLAIPLGLILIFIKYFKPRTLLTALSTLAIALAIGSQTPAMKERIHNSMGIQDRLRLWEANLDYFSHRPWTGIGWLKTQEMSEFYFKTIDPDHYQDYFWGHAHNNFFEMLGGTGIIGCLAWIFWTLFTLNLAKRTRLKAEGAREFFLADVASGIFVALLLLHFNGLTNVTFWEGKVMHQQMFAIGLLLMIQIAVYSPSKSDQ